MQMNTSVAPVLSTPPVNVPAAPMPPMALTGIHQRLNAMRAPIACRPDIDPRMPGGPRMRWNAAGVRTHMALGQYAVQQKAVRGPEDSTRQSISSRVVKAVLDRLHMPTARFVHNVKAGNVNDADFAAAHVRLVGDLSACRISRRAREL